MLSFKKSGFLYLLYYFLIFPSTRIYCITIVCIACLIVPNFLRWDFFPSGRRHRVVGEEESGAAGADVRLEGDAGPVAVEGVALGAQHATAKLGHLP